MASSKSATRVSIDNSKVGNLTVPQQISPAQQTNILDLIGNLQSSSTLPQTQSVGVYDSLGQLHNVVMTFTPPTAAGGDWVVSAAAADLSSGSSITVSGGNATASVAGSADLHFNSLGQLDGTATPLLLSFNGGLAPAQPATAGSTTTAQQPWNLPGTTIPSNAAQTAVLLNINDPQVGNLTQFASATSLQTQAAPGTPGHRQRKQLHHYHQRKPEQSGASRRRRHGCLQFCGAGYECQRRSAHLPDRAANPDRRDLCPQAPDG